MHWQTSTIPTIPRVRSSHQRLPQKNPDQVLLFVELSSFPCRWTTFIPSPTSIWTAFRMMSANDFFAACLCIERFIDPGWLFAPRPLHKQRLFMSWQLGKSSGSLGSGCSTVALRFLCGGFPIFWTFSDSRQVLQHVENTSNT